MNETLENVLTNNPEVSTLSTFFTSGLRPFLVEDLLDYIGDGIENEYLTAFPRDAVGFMYAKAQYSQYFPEVFDGIAGDDPDLIGNFQSSLKKAPQQIIAFGINTLSADGLPINQLIVPYTDNAIAILSTPEDIFDQTEIDPSLLTVQIVTLKEVHTKSVGKGRLKSLEKYLPDFANLSLLVVHDEFSGQNRIGRRFVTNPNDTANLFTIAKIHPHNVASQIRPTEHRILTRHDVEMHQMARNLVKKNPRINTSTNSKLTAINHSITPEISAGLVETALERFLPFYLDYPINTVVGEYLRLHTLANKFGQSREDKAFSLYPSTLALMYRAVAELQSLAIERDTSTTYLKLFSKLINSLFSDDRQIDTLIAKFGITNFAKLSEIGQLDVCFRSKEQLINQLGLDEKLTKFLRMFDIGFDVKAHPQIWSSGFFMGNKPETATFWSESLSSLINQTALASTGFRTYLNLFSEAAILEVSRLNYVDQDEINFDDFPTAKKQILKYFRFFMRRSFRGEIYTDTTIWDLRRHKIKNRGQSSPLLDDYIDKHFATTDPDSVTEDSFALLVMSAFDLQM